MDPGQEFSPKGAKLAVHFYLLTIFKHFPCPLFPCWSRRQSQVLLNHFCMAFFGEIHPCNSNNSPINNEKPLTWLFMSPNFISSDSKKKPKNPIEVFLL